MRLIFALLFSTQLHAMVSPTYLAYNRVVSAFAGDSCFQVQDPKPDGEKGYIVPVKVCSDERASAWQTIISSDFVVEFSGPSGKAKATQITGTTPAERINSLTSIINKALEKVPAFSKAITFTDDVPDYSPHIYIELKPMVIQVFEDDIFDRWGQHNFTAQDFYAQFLNLTIDSKIRVATTTTCMSPCNYP